jgi:hypothetical protein
VRLFPRARRFFSLNDAYVIRGDFLSYAPAMGMNPVRIKEIVNGLAHVFLKYSL